MVANQTRLKVSCLRDIMYVETLIAIYLSM